MKFLNRVLAALHRWGVAYDEPTVIVVDGIELGSINTAKRARRARARMEDS